jgi:hypothetical protein
MMLWDDVGGRTWTERAGPRAAIEETEARPRRRGRLRQISRARSRRTGAGVRGVDTPDRGPEGPR